MAEKIVVFGAGATGRGHVGLLAWQAGFEIVFVDKKLPLVELLRRKGCYTVTIFGEKTQEIAVSGYRVYHSLDRAAIAEEIRDARLVLTAVFDQNLADVAETLALGIAACARSGRTTPLNCIACENMMDSSTQLGRHVRTHLRMGEDTTVAFRSAKERHFRGAKGDIPTAMDSSALSGAELAWCEANVGFPDCMISRVVPRPEPDPLAIVTEDYNEWTARRESFRGEKPAALSALELVDNQTARLERKLFIHNGGHATCGYLAFHRGHRYIHEAVADPQVVKHVLGALDELGEVVRRKWGFSAESIDHYKQDLGRRGAIAEMRDEVLRVIRDPIRKLSPRERLVAPAMLAVEYGLPRGEVINAIVAALRYSHPADPQSLALSQQLTEQGLSKVLQNVCGIAPQSPLAVEIERAWQQWKL